MPYKNHTPEFVKLVIEAYTDLRNTTYKKLNGKEKKLFTQMEVAEIIKDRYGAVSVRTIHSWINGDRMDRGQGIGQKRGAYNTK